MGENFLDCVGVPEFFITTIGKVECAGAGCVRIYGCAERGGLLVPQYMVIMPMLALLRATQFVQDCALEIHKLEIGAMAFH